MSECLERNKFELGNEWEQISSDVLKGILNPIDDFSETDNEPNSMKIKEKRKTQIRFKSDFETISHHWTLPTKVFQICYFIIR